MGGQVPWRRSRCEPSASRSGLLGQGVRFALAGVTVAIVYISVTTVLSAVVGLPFQVALALGYCSGLSIHFTLQRFFVWAHHENFALPLNHQVGRYLLAAGIQYGLAAVATSVLPSVLGVAPEAVYLVVAPLLTAVNFIVFRYVIFHAAAG
jgi:putative flippase GtrA